MLLLLQWADNHPFLAKYWAWGVVVVVVVAVILFAGWNDRKIQKHLDKWKD